MGMEVLLNVFGNKIIRPDIILYRSDKEGSDVQTFQAITNGIAEILFFIEVKKESQSGKNVEINGVRTSFITQNLS